MVCFHPIPAYYPIESDSDGKRYLKFGRKRRELGVFSADKVWQIGYYSSESYLTADIYDSPYDFPLYLDNNFSIHGLNIKVPCGKCIGCKLDYSRMWATRSANEAYMHNYYNNCAFLTLTFNNDMLQRRTKADSLDKVAFRSWIKRLRKAIKTYYNQEIRFMACGEYGSRHKRPHYHILIYGFNFPDKYVYKYNKIHNKEVLYYRSPFLEKIWTPAYSNESYGFSVIGEVNFESSAYVARYVTKKLFGKYAAEVYKDKEPEFLTASRMPGLGYDYLLKFQDDIFNHGYIMLPNKHKAPIPRYYINKLKDINPELYSIYTIANWNQKIDNLFVKNLDSTTERLLVREELKRLNLDLLHREYEFNVS